jgi:hypothetical protein
MRKLFIAFVSLISFLSVNSQVLFQKRNEIKPETERETHLYNLLANATTTINLTFIDIDIKKLKDKNYTFKIEDKIYSIKDYRIEERKQNNFSVFANLNEPNGHIYLTILDDDILGNIRIEYQYYEIKTIGKGKYVLRKYDQLKYPNDCERVEKVEQHEELEKSKFNSPLTPISPSHINSNIVRSNSHKMAPTISQTCNLRIMVCFTPAVTANVNNPLNLCQQSVDLLNQTFINSGINHTAELAYAGEVNYTENDDNVVDRNVFGNPNDGIIDEIHQIRNDYSADIGVFLTTSTTGGGIAGVASGLYVDAPHAFCQVNYDYAVNNITFPHEIGHLLGGCHQDYSIPAYTDNHGFWTVTATSHFWPFLHYWGIRSIMCTIIQNNPPWTSYNVVRLPYWSNPNTFINWNGLRQFGSISTENNVRVFNQTISDAKTFRQSLNNLVVNSQIFNNNVGSHIAENIITSGIIEVQNGTNETFQAGTSVILTSGFHTIAGSNFLAKISTLSNCAGNPNAGGNSNGGEITVTWDETQTTITPVTSKIYPNPTSGIVNIEYILSDENEKFNISVTNSNGQLLQTLSNLSNQIGINKTQFDLSSYTEGIYFIQIRIGNKIETAKIIFKHLK